MHNFLTFDYSKKKIALLALLSLLLVAFGQPAFSSLCAALAAAAGWTPIFFALACCKSGKQRFFLALSWYAAVQIVQLSWLVSHPFLYIWIVYIALALLAGLQFGLLSLTFTPRNLSKPFFALFIAATWTLLEWSRLFFLSGFSWNPAGLALTANLYSLQAASVGGVFLLSFWVVWTNMALLYSLISSGRKRLRPLCLFTLCAALPYLFGLFQIGYHGPKIDRQIAEKSELFRALLVQTAFSTEETLPFKKLDDYIDYIIEEWRTIIKIVSPHLSAEPPFDLIVLPEFTVPFGTYTAIYPYKKALDVLNSLWPEKIAASALPLQAPPWSYKNSEERDSPLLATNAFWAQSIANAFHAPLLIGLEDAGQDASGQLIFYSGALFFQPQQLHSSRGFMPKRYAKRVLVPMGEYIPFSFLEKIAQKYGIAASFTPGTSAEVFIAGKNNHPFSPSICYEETFGDIMREGCLSGAKMLVNITSDVWYPNSLLPRQHFDLARLRTVENGVPLLRCCNTGITAALDSLGRIQAMLTDDTGNSEWVAAALQADLPTYTFATLYRYAGDRLVVALSFSIIILFGLFNGYFTPLRPWNRCLLYFGLYINHS